jgi:GDP/UDP-N,N'-diacetylbacillosamine 2-epimerase (hydrolysing)
MKKNICVLTSARAEYGLLKPVITKLNAADTFDVRIAVTGAHLSPEFGLTYREIEKDGFRIDEKIEILVSADTPSSVSKSMGLAMTGFADYFARRTPDLLIVLGDRYETFAVAAAALNQGIPIAHLYGGETTEGAVDEAYRHAITKMSTLHFTSTGAYRNRVIQLGEQPDRVYNVGAIGIENILHEKLLSKEELERSLGCDLSEPYAVVTFHPVTLEQNSAGEQAASLLEACRECRGMRFIFTKANADAGGRAINRLIDEYTGKNDHMVAFASLGTRQYLSALKYCAMVIGNSSSGLIEAPSFGIPTVNIGDRQRGRIQAGSVAQCEPDQEAIAKAMDIARSRSFRDKAKATVNPYGNGETSDQIVGIITEYLLHGNTDLKKRFYDCAVK